MQNYFSPLTNSSNNSLYLEKYKTLCNKSEKAVEIYHSFLHNIVLIHRALIGMLEKVNFLMQFA